MLLEYHTRAAYSDKVNQLVIPLSEITGRSKISESQRSDPQIYVFWISVPRSVTSTEYSPCTLLPSFVRRFKAVGTSILPKQEFPVLAIWYLSHPRRLIMGLYNRFLSDHMKCIELGTMM